jgi:hypothetical protein
MSSVDRVPVKVSTFADSSQILPAESPAADVLPRSASVGRTIARIRQAESERRDLQREAERLLQAGRVMQRD